MKNLTDTNRGPELLVRLSASAHKWRLRLGARPDSEHEQAVLRIIIGLIITAYCLVRALSDDSALSPAEAVPVWIGVAFCAVATLLFVDIVHRPQTMVLRRVFGILLDVTTNSCMMWLLDDAGIPLFTIFLWVAVGNGFRYGAIYLFLATVLSSLGFSVVMLSSPYWRQHFSFTLGLLLVLWVIPLYVSTLIHKLNRAIRRGEEANKAKSQFLARMSHELRTPLNGIIGMTYVLGQTNLGAEQKGIVETISVSGRMLSELIENVLDFSKIEAGKIEIEKVDFDLHALLNALLTVFLPQARAKGVDFRLHVAPDVPYLLRGDAFHLRQVLVNLISNAVKFTERGHIDLTVSLARKNHSDTVVRFEVHDTGIGIAPEAQERIFESFTQADVSTTRRYGGTGLGTTIARQLVQLMGGELLLQSSPGDGSVFWFEIPMPSIARVEDVDSGTTLAECRTLIVSNKTPDISDIVELLQRWAIPHQVVTGTAQAFAELMRAANAGTAYRAVLVDSNSDNIFPIQFVSATRSEPTLYSLSAILLRLPDDRRTAVDYMNAGYASVVQYPVDTRQFFNVLHSLVARESPATGAVVSLASRRSRAMGNSRRLRILVAEDNRTNQLVIESILTGARHRVDIVADGEAALEAIEKSTYDLVIADIHMPKLGGLEALRIYGFTTHTTEARVPWLILTGDATRETLEECAGSGADGYLTKPVQPALLLARVMQLTESAREAQVVSLAPRPPEERASDTTAPAPTVVASAGNSAVDSFSAEATTQIERMQHALQQRDHDGLRVATRILHQVAVRYGAGELAQITYDLATTPDSALSKVAGTMMHELVRIYEEHRSTVAATSSENFEPV